MIDTESKYNTITKNWGNRKERIEIAERIDKWLCQFEDAEKPLMLDLLRHFTYYSDYAIKQDIVKLYEEFKKVYNGNFILAPIQKEIGVGYSDFIYDAFWMKNDIKGYAERNLLKVAPEIKPEQIPAIVIIDDYSGSGKTFKRFHKKLMDRNPNLKTIKTFFLTLISSSMAIKKINDYASQYDYNIQCLSLQIQNRAFLDNFLYKKVDAEIKRRKYEEICRKHAVQEDFIFGFDKVEALVSFSYNTPNNTLGIIWHDLNDFCWVFQRHKAESTTLRTIQEDIKKREKIKTTKPVIQNIEEARVNVFMLYCVSLGKDFTLDKACKMLGLLPEQADELFSKVIGDGYISIENGYPEATAKLKEKMFVSRIRDFQKRLESNDEQELIAFDGTADSYLPKNF